MIRRTCAEEEHLWPFNMVARLEKSSGLEVRAFIRFSCGQSVPVFITTVSSPSSKCPTANGTPDSERTAKFRLRKVSPSPVGSGFVSRRFWFFPGFMEDLTGRGDVTCARWPTQQGQTHLPRAMRSASTVKGTVSRHSAPVTPVLRVATFLY